MNVNYVFVFIAMAWLIDMLNQKQQHSELIGAPAANLNSVGLQQKLTVCRF